MANLIARLEKRLPRQAFVFIALTPIFLAVAAIAGLLLFVHLFR